MSWMTTDECLPATDSPQAATEPAGTQEFKPGTLI
jgi:hypothetical protein